jgi:hypothetical protein
LSGDALQNNGTIFSRTSTLGTGMPLRISDKREPSLSAASNNLVTELEHALKAVLNAWFPRCVDTKNGGFRCDFNHRWVSRLTGISQATGFGT